MSYFRNNKNVLPGICFSLCCIGSSFIHSAELNDGELGATSTGLIQISLQVGESVAAGFLETTLGNPRSEYQDLLTHRIIEGFQKDSAAILPLCIYASEGGYFEVSSFETPGENGNTIQSEFGTTLPINIIIGDDEQERHQAVSDDCDMSTIIPVTIHLNESLNGEEIGRINGKFNLLVKTE